MGQVDGAAIEWWLEEYRGAPRIPHTNVVDGSENHREFLTLARRMHHFAQQRVEVLILQHTAGILRRC